MIKMIAAKPGEGKSKAIREEIVNALERGKSVNVYTKNDNLLSYLPENGTRVNYQMLHVYQRNEYDAVYSDLKFYAENNLMPDVVCLDGNYQWAVDNHVKELYKLIQKSNGTMIFTQQLSADW